jgi:hypothetical protein
MRDCLVLLVLCPLLAPTFAAAQVLESHGKVRLAGTLCEPRDLSGVAAHGELLVVCTDEGVRLNLLVRKSPQEFAAVAPLALIADQEAEIDAEGVASDGRHVFVVGSHSLARKKLEADRTHAANRSRLEQIDDEAQRHKVFRLDLNAAGRLVAQDSISLDAILTADPILAPFTKLPGKENGIDIEGVAAADGTLYFGFRGPVLRGNYVPVLSLKYDRPADYNLLFINCGGRGVRDLAAVKDGLLVLSGPVGDGDGSHELYLWNRLDCLPGSGPPAGKLTHLGTVPSAAEAKPEGLAVIAEADGAVELLLLCDGAAEPVAERCRVELAR